MKYRIKNWFNINRGIGRREYIEYNVIIFLFFFLIGIMSNSIKIPQDVLRCITEVLGLILTTPIRIVRLKDLHYPTWIAFAYIIVRIINYILAISGNSLYLIGVVLLLIVDIILLTFKGEK